VDSQEASYVGAEVHSDVFPGGQRQLDLTVNAKFHLFSAGDFQIDGTLCRQYQGVTQSQVAGYWLEDDFPGLRMENGSAGCQGVAGATGSGSHNHAIGPVSGQYCAINSSLYVDQTNRHTVQYYIIQGVKASVCHLSLKHGPFLDPAFPLEQTGQLGQDLVSIYLSDESQPAQVYT